jgi:hypothetical protein
VDHGRDFCRLHASSDRSAIADRSMIYCHQDKIVRSDFPEQDFIAAGIREENLGWRHRHWIAKLRAKKPPVTQKERVQYALNAPFDVADHFVDTSSESDGFA